MSTMPLHLTLPDDRPRCRQVMTGKGEVIAAGHDIPIFGGREQKPRHLEGDTPGPPGKDREEATQVTSLSFKATSGGLPWESSG